MVCYRQKAEEQVKHREGNKTASEAGTLLVIKRDMVTALKGTGTPTA